MEQKNLIKRTRGISPHQLGLLLTNENIFILLSEARFSPLERGKNLFNSKRLPLFLSHLLALSIRPVFLLISRDARMFELLKSTNWQR
jgi:hypothetical protein